MKSLRELKEFEFLFKKAAIVYEDNFIFIFNHEENAAYFLFYLKNKTPFFQDSLTTQAGKYSKYEIHLTNTEYKELYNHYQVQSGLLRTSINILLGDEFYIKSVIDDHDLFVRDSFWEIALSLTGKQPEDFKFRKPKTPEVRPFSVNGRGVYRHGEKSPSCTPEEKRDFSKPQPFSMVMEGASTLLFNARDRLSCVGIAT